jgi:hypothetical protein
MPAARLPPNRIKSLQKLRDSLVKAQHAIPLERVLHVTFTFTPGTTAGTPPQGNDARCGVACHTAAKASDFVFTEYGKR